MHSSLRGKIAIVTGGSKGIGRGICLQLAREDVSIVVVGNVDVGSGKKVVEEIQQAGGIAQFVRCDVTNTSDVEQLTERVTNSLGGIDILVNNAGVSLVKPFQETSEADWDRIIDVNMKGVFLCCRSVVPHMIGRLNGKIVNISSLAGKFASPLQVPYCASKWGVLGFTQALAYELAKYNINVNAICPGVVRTPMWEALLEELSAKRGVDKEIIFQECVESIPLKRAQTPEDIGNLVVFLCSEKARNITAQAISVTGGFDAFHHK